MGEGVVAGTPEAGAVTGEAAVTDVGHGNAQVLPQSHLQVAQHVAQARLAGYRYRGTVGVGQPGGYGTGPAEAQGGDVAPAQEGPGNQGVVHGAQLVAGVARFVGDEGIIGVQNLHQPGIDPVGVDGLVVGVHGLNVLGHAGIPLVFDLQGHILPGAGRLHGTVGQLVGQGLQGVAGVADDHAVGGVDLVDVQVVHVAVDNGLVDGIGDAVAEPTRGQAGAHSEDHVAVFQVIVYLPAPHPHEQGMIFGEGALALQGGNNRRVGHLGEGHQFLGRTGVDHPLAGVNDGPLGAGQQVNGVGHVLPHRAVLPALDGLVGVGGFVVGAGGVGNGQDDRAGAAAAQHGKSPAHELRHPLGPVDKAVPLGNGGQGVEDIVLAVVGGAGRHAVGDAQDGGAVLEGLGHAGVGVLGTGGVDSSLEGADADLATGGYAGEGVGHGHGVAVVAHHHHGNALPAEGVVDPADGEGGNPFHPFLLKNAGYAGGGVNSHW